MFNKSDYYDDIASSMENAMAALAKEDSNRADIKRVEVVSLLSTASLAFKEAGMHKYAEAAIALTKIVNSGCGTVNKMEKDVWAHFGNIHRADDGGEDSIDSGKTPEDEEYHKTHEGPGELAREKQESLEDKFLDAILGEDDDRADDGDNEFEDV